MPRGVTNPPHPKGLDIRKESTPFLIFYYSIKNKGWGSMVEKQNLKIHQKIYPYNMATYIYYLVHKNKNITAKSSEFADFVGKIMIEISNVYLKYQPRKT